MIDVGISLGWVLTNKASSFEELVRKADQEMYRHKWSKTRPLAGYPIRKLSARSVPIDGRRVCQSRGSAV